jgi:hypothetical protein
MRGGVLAGLVVALMAACFGGSMTGSSTITGEYTLRTVNGAPLPYTLSQSGTSKTEVVQDAITLFQGGTFARARQIRLTSNGQVTNQSENDTGAYTIFGTSLSLRSNATGQSTLATISGNTMTVVEAGVVSVYSK